MNVHQVVPAVTPGMFFSCPHCGHQYNDDLELLDNDVQHDVICENCGRNFVLFVTECQRCLLETSFRWREKPTSTEFASLRCASCNTSLIENSNAADDDEVYFGDA